MSYNIFLHFHCSSGSYAIASNIHNYRFYLKRDEKSLLAMPQIGDDISGFGVVTSIDVYLDHYRSPIIRIK